MHYMAPLIFYTHNFVIKEVLYYIEELYKFSHKWIRNTLHSFSHGLINFRECPTRDVNILKLVNENHWMLILFFLFDYVWIGTHNTLKTVATMMWNWQSFQTDCYVFYILRAQSGCRAKSVHLRHAHPNTTAGISPCQFFYVNRFWFGTHRHNKIGVLHQESHSGSRKRVCMQWHACEP